MTTGELVFYSGVGLLIFTLLLAVVFRIKRPRYVPEQLSHLPGGTGDTQKLRSGYPTDPLTHRRETGGAESKAPSAPGPRAAAPSEPPAPSAAPGTVPLEQGTVPLEQETVLLEPGTVPLEPRNEAGETELLAGGTSRRD